MDKVWFTRQTELINFSTMSLNTLTNQTITLAGVVQACRLVHQLATLGQADPIALEASLNSLLKIDSEKQFLLSTDYRVNLFKCFFFFHQMLFVVFLFHSPSRLPLPFTSPHDGLCQNVLLSWPGLHPLLAH